MYEKFFNSYKWSYCKGLLASYVDDFSSPEYVIVVFNYSLLGISVAILYENREQQIKVLSLVGICNEEKKKGLR